MWLALTALQGGQAAEWGSGRALLWTPGPDSPGFPQAPRVTPNCRLTQGGKKISKTREASVFKHVRAEGELGIILSNLIHTLDLTSEKPTDLSKVS